jgi:lipoprotein NlpI
MGQRGLRRRSLSVAVLLGLYFALLGLYFALAGVQNDARADALEIARAGVAAKERRQFPLAIQLIDEALRQGSSFTPEQKGMLFFQRGVSYKALGLRVRAVKDFDAAIALLPEFADAYNNRGIIWAHERDYNRALQDLLHAFRLAPDDPVISNNLGLVYAKIGDLVQAMGSYDLAIRLKPDYAEAYYDRAEVYATKREYERAIADYDRAISLAPTFVNAFANRGVVQMRCGAIDKAVADFGNAISLQPNDPGLLADRANALAMAGKYDDSVADFDRIVQIDPGNPLAYFGRGRMRLFAGDLTGSVTDFNTALRLRPDSPYPAIWLHIARARSGVDDREELANNRANVKRDTWLRALLDLYLGKLDADSVRTVAVDDLSNDRVERKCELDFYLAEFAVESGLSSEARRVLEAVSSECKEYDVLYTAAQAELQFLTKR